MQAIYNIYLNGEHSRTTNILGVMALLNHYDSDLKEGKKALINKVLQGETVDIDGHLSIN